jgi:RNA polymerase sigma-70 factor (ECF subfamily)
VCAGERQLFELLMRRHNQRLYRVARAIVRSDDQAEDVVQQAYIAAFAHLHQFAGEARFSTWLTRIAIREGLARLRRDRRRGEVDFAEGAEQMMDRERERTPEEHAAAGEAMGLLQAAIDELPEGYRLVFVMREVQQLSVVETAESLGLSEENVKVRLHRAKGMLRAALLQRVESAAVDAFPFMGARCDRLVATVMARLPLSDGRVND